MNVTRNVITETDFDRLRGLVHSRQGRSIYGPPAANLDQEIHRREIVASSRVPKGVVTMNSKVRIRDLTSDKLETLTLVYPKDANINEGRLSVLAPLGTALLGATIGSVVEVHAPAGVRQIRVERVLYQPEAAGDFDL